MRENAVAYALRFGDLRFSWLVFELGGANILAVVHFAAWPPPWRISARGKGFSA
jgi:hypothetical protein